MATGEEKNLQLAIVVNPTGDQSNVLQADVAGDAGGAANVPAPVSANGGANGHINEAERRPAGYERDPPIRAYEAELNDALWWARIIGFSHAVSQFLNFCNLTWATVALLGAFLPNLGLRDFIFVSGLVLLEAGRLASASLFMRLLLRPLAYHSQDPRLINHGADGHYPRSQKARNWSYGVQSVFISPSLVLPILGIYFIDHGSRNLLMSLLIFYSLVALNSLVSIGNLICSARAFRSLNKPPEQSILRYFDRVLENAMSSGVVQADNFEFFSFAYTMLGNEYRRGVQPEAVAKNHKKLIEYAYAHREGVDFLQSYLDAEDAFVRIAAVNMVGFWVEEKWGVGLGAEVALPAELLTKLADKMGMGQVGWAASTCIGVLACRPKWVNTLATMHTSSGVSLLDRVADILDVSSSRSLSLVRMLAQLYERLCVNKPQPPMPFTDVDTTLVPKLKHFASLSKRHRLRVWAAYLLLLMRKDCDRATILAIIPTIDNYWFRSEVSVLQLLRGHIDLPAFEFPSGFSIRDDNTDIIIPPWARLSTGVDNPVI